MPRATGVARIGASNTHLVDGLERGRDMSSPMLRAHVPLVPSPLNPQRQARDGAAQAQWRTGGGTTPATPATMARNVGVSPAQRLLRRKAAEAWRLEAPRRGGAAVGGEGERSVGLAGEWARGTGRCGGGRVPAADASHMRGGAG